MEEHVVYWFRRDLRVEDNCGLYHALSSGKKVIPLFIFDPNILSQLENKSDRRVDFIHQQIKRLQKIFVANGSSFFVFHESPVDAFHKLLRTHRISAVFTNHDYEPYAEKRDELVQKLLHENQVEFHSFKDQVIFEKSEVTKADGKPYTIFTPYSRVWKKQLEENGIPSFHSEKLLQHLIRSEQREIPTLKEMGFIATDYQVPDFSPDEEIIRHYDNTRNTPSLEGTTRMGIHLRFGTISVRSLAKKAKQLNETYLNELIWREFFMMILHHFPHVVQGSFRREYDFIPWLNNEKDFKAWCEGKTGYPMVDAGMRQLNETGWMHNRVRMITASFLAKHLLIDWRWGEAYFAEKLTDFELSANNGNWQWAAGCGCDAAPYFRVFNPTEQAKRFDPDFIYIRQWVKEFGTQAYSNPIVEHSFARNRALETYKSGLKK